MLGGTVELGRGVIALTTLLLAAAPVEVLVIVPLCDGAALSCGGHGLGDPRAAALNLYWGARYGAARFLEQSGRFQRATDTSVAPLPPAILQQLRLSRIGERSDRPVNVTLLAYDGGAIDVALRDFFDAVAQHRADLVVWMGHDRLMDVDAPTLARADAPANAAVLACVSESYFRPTLDALGARSVALTRTLMAPEGYLLAALLDNVARHGPDDRAALRRALVEAYARYQRISARAAASVFTDLDGSGG